MEDAYAYAKFARVALGTNDIDFRARAHSAEEAEFLGRPRRRAAAGVTYADLETAPAVLLAGFEPEEESPIVFLRLRKAVRKRGLRVRSIAPYASRGLTKLSGGLLPAVPGGEAAALDALHRDEAAGAAGRGDPGRRAPGRLARCAERRGPPRRRDRCAARVDPTPGRRTRSDRGGCAAGPAARRPCRGRPGGARRGRARVGRRRPARRTRP